MDERVSIAEIDRVELQRLLARIKPLVPPEDYVLLEKLLGSFLWLTRLVRQHGTTIARLRRLVGFKSSEKTVDVLGPQAAVPGSTPSGSSPEEPPEPPGTGGGVPGARRATKEPAAGAGAAGETSKPEGSRTKAEGHGRLPASAYPDAEHIAVPHESLRVGDSCPACGRGTLYELERPAQFLRIVGQAPLVAVCWDCQRLRCSACGAVHTASAPCEAQGPKYTETAASMIAGLRYGSGLPHHRLEQLQANLQTPVPASTQWQVVEERVSEVEPAHDELVRQAAQGSVLHIDDSRARILELMGRRRAALLNRGELEDPERTGLHTTAVVSTTAEGRKIALFFTGREHAGENCGALLDQRAKDLPPPIQMSDALACNNPPGHPVITCHCLAHGRRNIVDEVLNHPDECRHLLELIGRVFKVDETCRQQRLSDEERLRVHQRDSAPVMAEIETWMKAQFTENRIEPNSGLGEALNYLLKRWDKFTLFLRLPGVPLHNNICERALKMAIRHRNNSLFYRSQHGAEVGDIYMTLIHTAELNGANPFDYLTALQLHARAVETSPQEWMPWNYRDTLQRLTERDAPPSASQAA